MTIYRSGAIRRRNNPVPAALRTVSEYRFRRGGRTDAGCFFYDEFNDAMLWLYRTD